jgi:hypothetical protein
MPKKNRKKKGGDFDDYDDMLADPAPSSPVADGGGPEENCQEESEANQKELERQGPWYLWRRRLPRR